ncbi:hydroxyacid oxidase 1-like protein [Aphelenchoides avenae]|nr:hydroxyacid oxidase 1-like protein [Aphelenchus avenae]
MASADGELATVRAAVNAGFKALVLTVDAPTMGRRRADEKNGFQLPAHLRLANFDNEKFSRTHEADVGASGFAKYSLDLFDMSLTWKDLRWLVDYSPIPVIVKGIVRADDAISALDAGAAAIIVSNHGGRQLDSAVSTVYVDGGIRSGTDILKAVVLGADMVFIGRPIIYGLAAGGCDGVKHVLGLLQTEFDYALRLSGCASIEEARGIKDLVVREDSVLTGSLQSHTGNIPLSKL